MFKPLNLPLMPSEIPRLGNRFSQFLGCIVLKCMGWQFVGEIPPKRQMVLAVAPHTSNWDFVVGMAAMLAMKLKVSFLGKHSIFIPPFSGLLRKLGGIPVERSRSHGVVQQLVKHFDQSEQLLLGLAPEGTRSKVEHWKSGFLQIANQAQVPVLLVYFDYEYKVIGFGPLIDVGDDLELAMKNIRTFYQDVTAKYPELQ